MSGFGRAFRLTSFGESHGGGVGGIVEGCPPGIVLDVARLQSELDRRRPGQSALTTSRDEADRIELLSGVVEGRTLGSPIGFLVRNRDADPSAYAELADTYRPSHADYSTEAKYGLRAWAGGGRASARETIARVAAGAIARQVLETLGPVEIVAWVDQVHTITADVDSETVVHAEVESNAVRCPDREAAASMQARILEAKADGDSVGGIVRCVARGVPAGLGEPVFDKLEAELARAMLSLPATKGFAIGSGFDGVKLTGRQHNDPFAIVDGQVRTTSNRSGGIQGGISNGMPIEIAVAFKPTSTISHVQQTVTREGADHQIAPRGRHDPCVVPRAVPIVEAMMALVLLDHWLRWRGQVGMPPV